MSKQKTLKGSFSLCGKGLHTGLSLTVTFNPAPENTGYKIQRIDLEGEPVIQAVAENVVETQRGTVLGKGDIRVSTIEHGMSALYALGIDNCLIQVNGPEFPILDGSAAPYVEKIQSIGMQEHQVTIGDETFKLPSPFLVMATQNPIEQEGTYQLPEAQVDRFLLKVIIDYPTLEEEKLIIRENIQGGLPEVTPVTSAEEILKARKIVNEVYLDEKIEQYIADIVFASRYPERYGLGELKDMITFGGSPRASISLAKAARAYAFIKHRGYVIPEDVRAVAHDVLRHRVGLSYEAEASNVTSEEIVSRIINKVEVP